MGHSIPTPGLGLDWGRGLSLGQIDSDMSAELSIKLQKNLENCALSFEHLIGLL